MASGLGGAAAVWGAEGGGGFVGDRFAGVGPVEGVQSLSGGHGLVPSPRLCGERVRGFDGENAAELATDSTSLSLPSAGRAGEGGR